MPTLNYMTAPSQLTCLTDTEQYYIELALKDEIASAQKDIDEQTSEHAKEIRQQVLNVIIATRDKVSRMPVCIHPF